MNKTFFCTLSLVFLGMSLFGCGGSTTPRLDAHFGEAVIQARALQTINPDASMNTDPVNGLDGPAARHAIERYQDSFKTPPATFNVLTIGQ